MRKTILTMAVTAGVITALLQACNGNEKTAQAAAKPGQEEEIKRGEYLVSISGCDDCHTPKKMGAMGPEPDMSLRFSGYRSAVPFSKVDTSIIKQGWILANYDLTG